MLVHEDDSLRFDSLEVGAGRSDDGVEATFRPPDDVRSALPRPLGLRGFRLEDDHLPTRELQRLRVDAGEADLEHASGWLAQQLEDSRRDGGGECGRQTAHRYARYMNEKRTGKFLGVPYDWRRPTVARLRSRWWNDRDTRIFTPKSYGWGFDVNVAQVLRRLRVRR